MTMRLGLLALLATILLVLAPTRVSAQDPDHAKAIAALGETYHLSDRDIEI